MKTTFDKILEDYAVYLQSVIDSENSCKSYLSYVKSLDKNNNGLTLMWLKSAIQSEDPILCLSKCFDEYFIANIDVQPNNQWKTGLLRLGEFVCGYVKAKANMDSIKMFDSIACQLVAQSAIFCSVEVFRKVKEGELGSKENRENRGNEYGAWFHYTVRRAKHDEKRREKVNGVLLDDNTYANTAIKSAVLESLEKYDHIYGHSKQIFKDFEVCHIWPNTTYDERYHTSVANMVLLPRAIASLTDHCEEVQNMLKYESWKRFGFKPAEFDPPQRPKYYHKEDWKYTIRENHNKKSNDSSR